MSKIASADNNAMNALYKSELSRTGALKTAGEDIQAFKDHKEYEATVQSVLSDDNKESWDPNNEILD